MDLGFLFFTILSLDLSPAKRIALWEWRFGEQRNRFIFVFWTSFYCLALFQIPTFGNIIVGLWARLPITAYH